jgi:predicted DNA-binding transcriptional regulator AlpA
MRTLTTCNTYTRDAQGVWRYPWGHPVPSAIDLTLSDLMAIDGTVGCTEGIEALRPLTAAERRWLTGESTATDEILVRERPGHRPHAGDLIVGMSAPELHAMTMMTVADIAEAAGVSKSTIDSYRYRGYLPQPQITRSRTPLWARPIVRRWLDDRPGSGWRSDMYVDVPATTAVPKAGDAVVIPEPAPAA